MSDDNLSRRDVVQLGVMAAIGTRVPRRAARSAGPVADELQDGLARLVREHRMPGAVAGVYRDGRIATAGAGVANLNTNAPMTAELAFLTGSITKVWSATLIMTLVDEGLLDLDAPLVGYLPHLKFADPTVAPQLTTRHLLNHSSGVDAGDFILDLGEGPAANRQFVDAMAKLGQIHPPGRYSSYCNGGWVVAGHLAETLTKRSWHQLLTDRVIRPLGVTRTFTDAEDGLLYGAAIGSVPDASRPGFHMATPKVLLPKTFAAAGATLLTNVRDNLTFARMHLAGGVAPNGTRVISAATAAKMATRTIDHPSGPVTGFGLGWAHSTAGGRVTLSHGGGSNGGRAMLVAVPGSDFAYATFVNSNASELFQAALSRWLVQTFQPGGLIESPPAPASGPIDPRRFVGRYRRATLQMTIREDGGKLIAENETIAEEYQGASAYGIGATSRFEMRAASPTTLVLASADPSTRPTPWTFLEPDEAGRFHLMYASGRLARRIPG